MTPDNIIDIFFLKNSLFGILGLFLVLLMLLYFVFPRLFSGSPSEKYINSRFFSHLVLLAVSITVILASVLVWQTLSAYRKQRLHSVEQDLKSVQQNTIIRLDFFVKERENYLLQLGRDAELIHITQKLLKLPKNKIKKSDALQQARDFFVKRVNEFGRTGFFIISPDNISIASQRNNNLATLNFISLQWPQRIKQAFAGNAVFIPPTRSDVLLSAQSTEYPKTLFFAVPVEDGQGKVIAVLMQRLMPEKVLSQITQQSYAKESIESYLVCRKGTMLTESRFKSQLMELGIIVNETSYSQIELRSPKGSLLEAYQPDSPFSSWPYTRMAQSVRELSQQQALLDTQVRYSKMIVDMQAYRDYRGVWVYGAWIWDNALGIAIASEVDVAEAMQSYTDLRQNLLWITGIILLLSVTAIIFTLLFTQRAARILNNAQRDLEAQVAIRTRELKKLSVAVEQSPVSIAITNRHAELEYVNPHFTQVTGYSVEEVLGKNPRFLQSKQTPEKTYVELWACLKRGEVWSGELINQRKNGAAYWEKTVIAPIRNELGTITHYVAVKEDITEQKRIEERNTRLGRILENSLNEIYLFDVETLLFIKANKGARNNLGYSQEELEKLTPLDINPDVSRAGFMQLVAPLLEGKLDFLRFQTTHQRRNGSIYPVEVHLQIEKGQTSPAFVAIIQDITERNKAEVLLKQAKAGAEQANLVKSQFLANMSHELRTPLNAILGFSQIIVNDENLTSKQQGDLQIINNSGEHLLSLINDILDLSKIEAGEAVLYPINFSLNQLLSNLKSFFQSQLKAKSLQLHCHYDDNFPQTIYADKTKLRQIFVNLISNAIKFSDKGNINIQVRHQRINNKLMLEFGVKDTGHGIAEEELDKIFKSFVQSGSGIKSQTGTGLGLSICQQLVQLMGGKISVESQLNEGAVFTFNVLLDEAKHTEIKEENTHDIIGLLAEDDVYRILVVDDNELNRLLLVELLAPVGFELKQAENGLQAIECYKDWQPHCILMDMRMPVMDGYEATRQIKALSRQAIIIAITANVLEDKKELALQVGCDDYIVKPFNVSDIFSRIKVQLGVHYLYKKKPDRPEILPVVIDKESIALLADELQEQLKQAIACVDIETIEQLLEKISLQDTELSDAIRQKINSFEYELLLELFR